LKRVERRNLGRQSLATLETELRRAKERLRHQSQVIRCCILQPGYLIWIMLRPSVIASAPLPE
jgi:hypothetical protein